MLNDSKNTPPNGNQNTPIPVIRADVPPLGETYSGATVQAVQTGEIITLDIEFYRASKTRVVLTPDQALQLATDLLNALTDIHLKAMEVQP